MNLSALPLLDLIALSIVGLACLRGLWIGLIREGLSLATVGIATVLTRLYLEPVAGWVAEKTGGELTGRTGLWIAGVLIVLATIVVLGLVGRLVRRSAELAGLGWADRMGGGALGMAEGGVVASIVVVIALWLVGPNHASTRDARSVALVEGIRAFRETGTSESATHERGNLPGVASPGSWRGSR